MVAAQFRLLLGQLTAMSPLQATHGPPSLRTVMPTAPFETIQCMYTKGFWAEHARAGISGTLLTDRSRAPLKNLSTLGYPLTPALPLPLPFSLSA